MPSRPVGLRWKIISSVFPALLKKSRPRQVIKRFRSRVVANHRTSPSLQLSYVRMTRHSSSGRLSSLTEAPQPSCPLFPISEKNLQTPSAEVISQAYRWRRNASETYRDSEGSR